MTNEMTRTASEVQNKIIIAVSGEDEILDYDRFGLTFESSETDVLQAISGLIFEKYSVELRDESGAWLYKTRKAMTSRNIYVIPNSTAGAESPSIPYLDSPQRLKAFEQITAGCQHLWSKNKLQETKMNEILTAFSALAEKDPLFLAKFTSYAFKNLDSKDLKVVSCFMSSLSDADGTPFSPGSEFKKPNWRVISQAAFCQLDPKLALRVLKLANSKRTIGSKTSATHFSRHIKTAAKKYLRYREANPKILEGIKKAGLGNTLTSMYRIARVAPSVEAVKILRWKQKPGFPGSNVKIEKSTMFDFTGLTDTQIAEKIRANRLKPQPVLGALPDKISPVIAAAILEQCTGDQAVVLTSMLEDQGLLKNKEVKKLYAEKIATAKQALDRVERIKQDLAEETKAILREAKSAVRKEQVGNVGKIFEHIDVSGSMSSAIEIAKNRSSIIAECVQNPKDNFHWGLFNSQGFQINHQLTKFTKDDFAAALYGVHAGGGTNCLALFGRARELGCETDVYITDGAHTDGDVATILRQYIARGVAMPKQVVIVKCGSYVKVLEDGFRAVGVPVSTIDEAKLTESALVTQAIKTALLGATAVIDDILKEEFIELPKWWGVV